MASNQPLVTSVVMRRMIDASPAEMFCSAAARMVGMMTSIGLLPVSKSKGGGSLAACAARLHISASSVIDPATSANLMRVVNWRTVEGAEGIAGSEEGQTRPAVCDRGRPSSVLSGRRRPRMTGLRARGRGMDGTPAK